MCNTFHPLPKCPLHGATKDIEYRFIKCLKDTKVHNTQPCVCVCVLNKFRNMYSKWDGITTRRDYGWREVLGAFLNHSLETENKNRMSSVTQIGLGLLSEC